MLFFEFNPLQIRSVLTGLFVGLALLFLSCQTNLLERGGNSSSDIPETSPIEINSRNNPTTTITISGTISMNFDTTTQIKSDHFITRSNFTGPNLGANLLKYQTDTDLTGTLPFDLTIHAAYIAIFTISADGTKQYKTHTLIHEDGSFELSISNHTPYRLELYAAATPNDSLLSLINYTIGEAKTSLLAISDKSVERFDLGTIPVTENTIGTTVTAENTPYNSTSNVTYAETVIDNLNYQEDNLDALDDGASGSIIDPAAGQSTTTSSTLTPSIIIRGNSSFSNTSTLFDTPLIIMIQGNNGSANTTTPSDTPSSGTIQDNNGSTNTATPSNTPSVTIQDNNGSTNTATPSDTPSVTIQDNNGSTNTATLSNTPSVTIQYNNGYTNTTTLSILVTAQNATNMRFSLSKSSLNEAQWETYASTKTYTIPDIEGIVTLWAEFKDAQNNTATVSDTTTYDKTPPTLGSIAINNTPDNCVITTGLSLTLSSSGADQMQFSLNDDTFTGSNWIDYAPTALFTIPDTTSEGLITVYVRFRDTAGNMSPRPQSDTTNYGDQDGDTICDLVDNCITTANASQQDTDGDGTGDACDGAPQWQRWGLVLDGYENAKPNLWDGDGDGDQDLLIGRTFGGLTGWENIGSITEPNWRYQANWNISDLQYSLAPATADLDGDGDLDMVVGRDAGDIRAYRNTTPSDGNFEWTAEPTWDLFDLGAYTVPSLHDFDSDGLVDMAVGIGGGGSSSEHTGYTVFFKNRGTTNAPKWQRWGLIADDMEHTNPKLQDLDDDGDLDLLIGTTFDGIHGYENTGSATIPVWTRQTAWDISINYQASPAIGDLNGDGLYDLLIGLESGNTVAYKNTGTAGSPSWTAEPTWDIPDNLVSAQRTAPQLVDFDGDGDLDAFISEQGGVIYAYENTDISNGDATLSAPTWSAKSDWNFPDMGGHTTFVFVNLDDNSDLEIITGDVDGYTRIYKNTGSVTTPTWTRQTNWEMGVDFGTYSVPAAGDLDGDGIDDLLIANYGGLIRFIAITTRTSEGPTMVMEPYPPDSWTIDNVGRYANPTFVDFDGDGDLDAFIGESSGITYAFENTGGPTSPEWNSKSAWTLPDLGQYAHPTLRDMDGDGDIDAMVGDTYGLITFVTNISPKTDPQTGTIWSLSAKTPDAWDGLDVGNYADPACVDLNKNGAIDLIIGNSNGQLTTYENTNTPTAPVWTANGNWNLTDDVGGYASPTLADLDGDGDLDMLVGRAAGDLVAYENTSTNSNPTWAAKTEWNLADIGAYAHPILVDLDGDSDYDLIVGEQSGSIFAYENSNGRTSPTWYYKSSWNPPPINYRPRPAAADIDQDGDVDLLVGTEGGTIYGIENTTSTATNGPTWSLNSAWNLYATGGYTAPCLANIDNAPNGLPTLVVGLGGDGGTFENSGKSFMFRFR